MEAEASFWGDAYSQAGTAVGSLGDINVDGFDDLVIGAECDRTAGNCAGAAYVVLGPVSGAEVLEEGDASVLGWGSDAHAGASLAGMGDMDADGLPDLAVGALGADEGGDAAGATYVLLGAGALLSGITAR